MLSLDRNALSELEDSDLFGLSRSTRLESLSLAANNITVITPRAFQPVQQVVEPLIENVYVSFSARDAVASKQPHHLTLARLTALSQDAEEVAASVPRRQPDRGAPRRTASTGPCHSRP